MLALGVSDQQNGTVASVGQVFKVFSTLISGVFVDKYGHRLTLFIFDLISWSVHCLIWAVAQDVRYFIIAVVINAIFRFAHNAWTCLLVEDTKLPQSVGLMVTSVLFEGVAASFVSPIIYSLLAAIRNRMNKYGSALWYMCYYCCSPCHLAGSLDSSLRWITHCLLCLPFNLLSALVGKNGSGKSELASTV